MRTLFLVIFLSISSASFSQTKTEKFLDTYIQPVRMPKSWFNISYFRGYEIGKTDTAYVFSLYFQNAEFSRTTDLKTIGFTKEDEFNQFVSDLIAAYDEIQKGSPSNLRWLRKKYIISIQEKSKEATIFVTNMNDPEYLIQTSGFAYITKTHFENIFTLIRPIKFGLPLISENK